MVNKTRLFVGILGVITGIVVITLVIIGILSLFLPQYLAEKATGYDYCKYHNGEISTFDCNNEDEFGDIEDSIEVIKLNIFTGKIINRKPYR